MDDTDNGIQADLKSVAAQAVVGSIPTSSAIHPVVIAPVPFMPLWYTGLWAGFASDAHASLDLTHIFKNLYEDIA